MHAVEGLSFTAVVANFSDGNLSLTAKDFSATINWGPTATPTSSVGTINLIGSTFIPNVGTVPQYSVTGGTTYPEGGVGTQPQDG